MNVIQWIFEAVRGRKILGLTKNTTKFTEHVEKRPINLTATA